MKKVNAYKKLPGRNRSISGQSSLWLGADHLLAVDRIYFEERYRRFHFADFQALVVKSTSRWHLTTVILAVLTLVMLAPGWMLWQENEFELATMAFLPAVCCLIGLIVNLVKGKSCRCYLQMRVGIHDLPSIRRRRQAEKILGRISPLIGHAQKGIEISKENMAAPSRKAFRDSRSDEKGFRPYSGTWHLVLYAVLAIDIVLTFMMFFKSGMFLYIMNSVAGIALLFAAVAALVAQRNTALPASARTSTWAVMAMYIVSMIVGYFYFIFFFLLKQPELLTNQSALNRAMADLQIMEHPFLMVLFSLYISVGIACTVFGLSGTFSLRRGSKVGASA
jgi:hypothetical protein